MMNKSARLLQHCDDPVFIVGAPRTSSSFWLTALVECCELVGSSEGHLLELLDSLDDKVVGFYAQKRAQGLLAIPDNMLSKVPEHSMRHAILDVFRNYFAQQHGDNRWVDKTVNAAMILALPYLMVAWPRARIIYLKRSGIGNVQSAINYFQVSFETACRNWARCGEVWERTRELLPTDSFIEVEHSELLSSPAEVAGRVASHLGFSHYQREVLADYVVQKATVWRDKRGGDSTFVSSDWSQNQRREFLRICGDQMLAQGYFDEFQLITYRSQNADDSVIPISPATARVLQVDDHRYCQFDGDSIYVVPGRNNATLILFENIHASGQDQLEVELEIVHPESQGIRFEFVGFCRSSGELVLHARKELLKDERALLSVKFYKESNQIDLLLRVVTGSTAETNDYSWGCVRNLRLSAQAPTVMSV